MARQQNMSEETAKKVDSEIRKLVDKGYLRAKKVLKRITLVLKDTDRVFPISETQLRYYFEKMRNTFPEMEDVTPHTMRHTFCTRLVQGGKPINEVKELMGHSEITTTMRYAHFAPKRGTSDVSLLDEFSSGLE